MGKYILQAKQWPDMCYSDSAPSETIVKRWYADFKGSCSDTNDAKHSGCPENSKILH